MFASPRVFARTRRAPCDRSAGKAEGKNSRNEYPALTYRWTFAGNACYEVLAPAVSRCGCGFSGVRVKRRGDVAHRRFSPLFFTAASSSPRPFLVVRHARPAARIFPGKSFSQSGMPRVNTKVARSVVTTIKVTRINRARDYGFDFETHLTARKADAFEINYGCRT